MNRINGSVPPTLNSVSDRCTLRHTEPPMDARSAVTVVPMFGSEQDQDSSASPTILSDSVDPAVLARFCSTAIDAELLWMMAVSTAPTITPSAGESVRWRPL